MLDSACVLYWYKFPDYRVPDSLIINAIERGRNDLIDYQKRKYYEQLSKKYYLYSQEKKFIYIVDIDYYSVLQIEKFDTSLVKKSIYATELSKEEKKLIRLEFDSIIVPRLELIVKELTDTVKN